MASIPATIVYPNNVYIPADRPGIKAGGTDGFAAPPAWPQWYAGSDPFTAAKLRKARRHGGAVPWSMVKEIQNRFGPPEAPNVVPPPASADAHYVSEIVSHLEQTPPVGVYWFDYMYGGSDLIITYPPNPGDPYNFQPNAKMLQYLNASWPNLATILARPEAPVLSADDPYLAPGLSLTDTHLTHGPLPAVVLGAMTRMHLIKPASSDLNTRAVGSQSQYFVEIAGCGQGVMADFDPWIGLSAWSGTNWTAKLMAGSTYWSFGLCEGGWTYAIEIDPETGKVANAYPMPEGRTREGKMFGAYLSNNSSWAPTFWAISWPTGVRSFTGGWYNPYITDPTPPRVMWKLARPWVFRCRAQTAFDPWNGSSTPPGFMPSAVFPSAPTLWRGYEPGDDVAMRAGTGGWTELCHFPAADPTGTGDLGAPVWGTLPNPGDEVMLTFTHPEDYYFAPYGDPNAYLRLVPEATVSPVNIPMMHGGIIPGGTP